MIQILLILSLLVCVLLVCIVLIQNPKGGGLSSNFSASSQLMGVQKTGDFLEKGTWGLAIFLMVLALAINVAAKGSSAASTTTSGTNASKIKTNTTAPAMAPNLGQQGSPIPTGTQQPAAPASQPATGKK